MILTSLSSLKSFVREFFVNRNFGRLWLLAMPHWPPFGGSLSSVSGDSCSQSIYGTPWALIGSSCTGSCTAPNQLDTPGNFCRRTSLSPPPETPPNPFHEREYLGDDIEDVCNKWYDNQRYMRCIQVHQNTAWCWYWGCYDGIQHWKPHGIEPLPLESSKHATLSHHTGDPAPLWVDSLSLIADLLGCGVGRNLGCGFGPAFEHPTPVFSPLPYQPADRHCSTYPRGHVSNAWLRLVFDCLCERTLRWL